jgi:hypothetical protein
MILNSLTVNDVLRMLACPCAALKEEHDRLALAGGLPGVVLTASAVSVPAAFNSSTEQLLVVKGSLLAART